MEGEGFIDFAEAAVGYVDERFGRPAAWFCAAFMIVLPPMFVVLTVLWLFR